MSFKNQFLRSASRASCDETHARVSDAETNTLRQPFTASRWIERRWIVFVSPCTQCAKLIAMNSTANSRPPPEISIGPNCIGIVNGKPYTDLIPINPPINDLIARGLSTTSFLRGTAASNYNSFAWISTLVEKALTDCAIIQMQVAYRTAKFQIFSCGLRAQTPVTRI